jgi:transposase
MKADPDSFLAAIAPYRDQIAVAVECIFTWYWLADLCAREKITFVLGHALYMKAIHGGKAKNDKIDAQKIAALLRGGMIRSYVYPNRCGRLDLLRRRMQMMHQRSCWSCPEHEPQYNLPDTGKKISYSRTGKAAERFADPSTRSNALI